VLELGHMIRLTSSARVKCSGVFSPGCGVGLPGVTPSQSAEFTRIEGVRLLVVNMLADDS
jgi:hypothetical protein